MLQSDNFFLDREKNLKTSRRERKEILCVCALKTPLDFVLVIFSA